MIPVGDLLAAVSVRGRPRTKGSLKPIVDWARRKVRLVEDHAASKPWRLKMVAQLRKGGAPARYAGAVQVQATFWFARTGPTALSRPWPMVNGGVNANGDLDKLERNLLDALKDAGVYLDDSQVVSNVTSKRWAPEPHLAGVDVAVYAVRDDL